MLRAVYKRFYAVLGKYYPAYVLRLKYAQIHRVLNYPVCQGGNLICEKCEYLLVFHIHTLPKRHPELR